MIHYDYKGKSWLRGMIINPGSTSVCLVIMGVVPPWKVYYKSLDPLLCPVITVRNVLESCPCGILIIYPGSASGCPIKPVMSRNVLESCPHGKLTINPWIRLSVPVLMGVVAQWNVTCICVAINPWIRPLYASFIMVRNVIKFCPRGMWTI